MRCDRHFFLTAALTGVVLLWPGRNAGQQPDSFHWPGGARAAVCLTYDDGLDGDLDRVAPDLERANLHGTFFAPGGSASLYKRLDEWRDLVRRGHELGSHSMFHPCVQSVGGRVVRHMPPERALENYTVGRMTGELKAMNTLLYAIDHNRTRTFAYPCGNTLAGGESFIDSLRPLFVAARTGAVNGQQMVTDPRSLDIHLVPSWPVPDVHGEKLIAFAEEALNKGTVAVFQFHGVGGGHAINIDREEHRKLLSWLAAHKDKIWTETFCHVMQHVLRERQRPG